MNLIISFGTNTNFEALGYCKSKFPMSSHVCSSVGWLVGLSLFLKRAEIYILSESLLEMQRVLKINGFQYFPIENLFARSCI